MKNKKIFACVAAGIAAAAAITVSAIAFPQFKEAKLSEFEEQLLCGIYPDEGATEEEIAIRDSKWNSVKLQGAGVVDCLSPDNTIVGEDGLTDADRQAQSLADGNMPALISADEKFEDELNEILAAERSSDIRLEEINNGQNYKLWSGRFTFNDLATTTVNFTEPAYFNIKIANGKDTTMTATTNYTKRFKILTVYSTYLKTNGSTIRVSDRDEGGESVLTANPTAVSGAKLVETVAYFCVYDGDNALTDYTEIAIVHLVDSTYAKSAQYAENSYANLIDTYTHIEN